MALVFALIAISVVVLGHTYLYRRFRNTLGPDRRRIVLVLVAVLGLCVLAMPALWVTGIGRNEVVGYLSFTAIGVFSLLATLRAIGDLLLISARVSQWRRQGRNVDEGRRLFLRRAVDVSVVGGAAVLGGTGAAIARSGPELFELDIVVPGLDPALDGFRIAQISDLHVGPTIGRSFVQPVVDRVNALNPDLIAVTGDLVDGSPEDLADSVAPLAELRATHGVFFCTGNHEYYSGADRWVEKVRTLGMRPLMNEHVVIGHGGAAMCVAGVTDVSGHDAHKSDPEQAAAGAPSSSFKLLLAHQPRSAFAAAKAGFDLQLSGHTHGGQFFPWNFVIHLVQPFVSGLHLHEKMQVYVNRGTAYWGPPLRLGPSSEITLLRLRVG